MQILRHHMVQRDENVAVIRVVAGRVDHYRGGICLSDPSFADWDCELDALTQFEHIWGF